MRFIFPVLLALTLSSPATFAGSKCACDKKCVKECKAGNHENCKCSDCDCKNGTCKHGKCSMKKAAAEVKPDAPAQEGAPKAE
jgi:hypothetical protein